MTQTIYHVSVMPNWEEAVGREGLGLLYGSLLRDNEGPHVTLYARLVRKVGGFSIYQAVWACYERESQVTTRRGYIARGHGAWDDIGGCTAFGHADTPERALRIARWRLAYWPRRERWRLRLWPLTQRLRVLARKPRSYARRFWLLAREPALIAEWLWLFRYYRSRRASGGETAEDEAAKLRERRLILAGKHPFRKTRVTKRGRDRPARATGIPEHPSTPDGDRWDCPHRGAVMCRHVLHRHEARETGTRRPRSRPDPGGAVLA